MKHLTILPPEERARRQEAARGLAERLAALCDAAEVMDTMTGSAFIVTLSGEASFAGTRIAVICTVQDDEGPLMSG